MALKQTVRVDGLKELDQALGELSRAVGRNVLKRVLKRAGQPIADKAAQLAPDDPATAPPNDLHSNIIVAPKISNKVGNAEYSEVLQSGGTKAEAVSAMRGARRAAKGKGSFAEMYVGPRSGRNSHIGSLQEFGSVNNPPHPFMRPAFEQHKDEALAIVARDLGGEIDKAAKRAAARAAAKGK